MSIRDILIKSSELGFNKIAIISEMKGNPSRIDFQDVEGELILSLEVTVGIPNSNANSKSRINSERLTLHSEVPALYQLGQILDIPKSAEVSSLENLMEIKKGNDKYRALIEFYGNNGMESGLKIFIKEWRS
jgi:U3 small nucleolar ribonucleoprotein protein IMP4